MTRSALDNRQLARESRTDDTDDTVIKDFLVPRVNYDRSDGALPSSELPLIAASTNDIRVYTLSSFFLPARLYLVDWNNVAALRAWIAAIGAAFCQPINAAHVNAYVTRVEFGRPETSSLRPRNLESRN